MSELTLPYWALTNQIGREEAEVTFLKARVKFPYCIFRSLAFKF